MVDPEELSILYGDFIAEAEFEFEDKAQCMFWCDINYEFLKWLAEENRIRANSEKVRPGSFDHMRRLLSADA